MAFKPFEFFRAVKAEGTKVSWPTRKETMMSTLMVFVMCTVCAVFLVLVDWVSSSVIQFILG